MLEKINGNIHLQTHGGRSTARHSEFHCGGAEEISFEGKTILRNMHSYIGPLSDKDAMVRRIKDYHKAQETIIEVEGYLPYGGECEFHHSFRYSERLLRISSDINIRGGSSVDRHLGVCCFELPGQFKKLRILPAAQHLCEGGDFHEREIGKWDKKDLMIGHWHRPPLLIQLVRKDNLVIEICTGSDLWRWEQNLGYHPESGSYKLILTQDGIKYIREPLACCEDFTPEQRNYRFTSSICWYKQGKKKASAHSENAVMLPVKPHSLDVDWKSLEKKITDRKSSTVQVNVLAFDWQDTCLRVPSSHAYVSRLVSHEPCWCSDVPSRTLKKVIRRLLETKGVENIILKGLREGLCYNPSHLRRTSVHGLAHWDINGHLDFLQWAAKTCKDRCTLTVERREEDGVSLSLQAAAEIEQ